MPGCLGHECPSAASSDYTKASVFITADVPITWGPVSQNWLWFGVSFTLLVTWEEWGPTAQTPAQDRAEGLGFASGSVCPSLDTDE